MRESGFEIDDFGEGTVIVRACPLNLEKENIVSLITEIAGYLLKNQRDILPEKLDWIYHSIACRAAIKAGNNNSDYELMRFVKKLLTDKDVRYCPHGRPVIVEMTKYELDKQFRENPVMDKIKILVIVGPTASGKTALSISCAGKVWRRKLYLRTQCKYMRAWI